MRKFMHMQCFGLSEFRWLKVHAELLKAEDVRKHFCAIFLRICAKFVLLNAKQEKQAFFMIWAQFDNYYFFFFVVMAF